MSNTNGATTFVVDDQGDLHAAPPEAPPKPPPPIFTEDQWRALAEAASAVKQADAERDRAQSQWRLVCAATGIQGAWTIDPFGRTISPA